MKIFRQCALLSASLVLATTPTNVSKSCGNWDEELTNPTYFFDQTIIGRTPFAPLLYTPREFYTNEWDSDSIRKEENLNDWIAHIRPAPRKAEVEDVVYQSNEEFLKAVLQRLSGSTSGVSEAWLQIMRSNSWLWSIIQRKDTATIEYLLFARSCEPYATIKNREQVWSDEKGDYVKPPGNFLPAMDSLIRAGLQRTGKGTPRFLRERYGYQVVRMARYAGYKKRCIMLYDSLLAPLKSQSPVTQWALAHKAGAQLSVGLEADAAYNFSLVFSRDPGSRRMVLYSFRVENDSVWQECLKRCRSVSEKSMLYFLVAIRPWSNALEEMQEIYKLDNTSDLLLLLLVREIAKVQDGSTTIVNLKPTDEERSQREATFAYLKKFNSFISRCRTEGHVKQPDVWKLAEGFTFYLIGNPSKARALYAELREESRNKKLLAQIPLLDLAASISTVNTVTTDVEDRLYKEVRSARNEYLLRYFLRTIKPLYTLQGDTLKAYLCDHPPSALRYYPHLTSINAFLRMANKKVKTPAELYLLSYEADGRDHSYYYEDFYPETKYPPASVFLREIRATLLLAADRLPEAIAEYKRLPVNRLVPLHSDPFTARINDCRDCDFALAPQREYNKLTLAEELVALKNKVKSQPDSAAQFNFLLGCAYYNMTHFGNSAEVLDYSRQSGYLDCFHSRVGSSGQGNIEYVDCSRAREYFVAAMTIAETKRDPELAARACFMAAKCEQNAYYLSIERAKGASARNAGYRTYFGKMMKDFSNTQYYREVLQECKYFSDYVRQ